MDKFLVRFSILALNVYMVIATVYAFNGIDISEYDYLFTNSFLFGALLTSLCHAHGRYHCVWMRALCYNLMIMPLLNFIDAEVVLFGTIEQCIYTFCAIFAINILATIILAINHFRLVRKVLKKHKYEELRPIKCNCTRKD